jgi:hypothetical protein
LFSDSHLRTLPFKPVLIAIMNKAFVREAEDTGAGYCPQCGSLAIAVGTDTLAAHLDAESRKQLANAAFYCPYPKCAVAYFDRFERTVAVDQLRRPTYPKDPSAPICNCFGFTTAEIDADIREGTTVRIKTLLAKSKSAEARCAMAAPDGRCCAAEVQRYYMRTHSNS